MSILASGRTDFCTQCRKWTKYSLQEKNEHHMISGKEYVFPITEAICSECGAYMCPPGLLDLNVEEYCDWYENRFHEPINRGNSAC